MPTPSTLHIRKMGKSELRHFPDYDGHEAVYRIEESASGYVVFIGIHDTTLGKTALGGCRFLAYATEVAAIEDVLRLSRGMTYKSALAGVSFGGGKAVIMAPDGMDPRDKNDPRRSELFHFLGRAVGSLSGAYATGEDMNVSPQDLENAVLGILSVGGDKRFILGTQGKSGNPASFTALGVFLGILALHPDPMQNVSIAIQGLGNVGMSLARMCHRADATIIACDPDPARCAEARRKCGATIVELDAIYEQECTILAPCAMGGIINDKTIPLLRCDIIAGSANNQLATPHDGEMLQDEGIMYAPDYVINAGGLINVAAELDLEGYTVERVHERLPIIVQNLQTIMVRSFRSALPMSVAADQLAKERLYVAHNVSG